MNDPIDPRIASVEAQINACMRGATDVINCPFCGSQNRAEYEALCCPDMGSTVRVILRKQAQRECLDNAERILEIVSRN